MSKTVEMKEVISDTQIRSAISYFAAVVDKKKAGDIFSRVDKSINITPAENPTDHTNIALELAKLLRLSTRD